VGRARFERATNWLKADGYPAETPEHKMILYRFK